MKIDVKLEGIDKLNKKLRGMNDKVKDEYKKELRDVALSLQGEAQDKAPVDTADLRGSAFAVIGSSGNFAKNTETDKNPKSKRLPIPKASKLEAIVGFTEPYALRQHEEMEYEHRLGGQAKYLSQPLEQNWNKYYKALGDAIKRGVHK